MASFTPVEVADATYKGDEGFPEFVECLTYGGNRLYVGTSHGSVLSYAVPGVGATAEELQYSGRFERAVNLLTSRGICFFVFLE